jgi:hypothetical protein
VIREVIVVVITCSDELLGVAEAAREVPFEDELLD